jgi:hypothetical protein
MGILTEWFEGRHVDEQEREHERAYWGRVLAEIACAVCAGLILAGLPACASSPSPRSEVCTMQLLGQTENRVPVVGMTCVTPEQFAESQK